MISIIDIRRLVTCRMGATRPHRLRKLATVYQVRKQDYSASRSVGPGEVTLFSTHPPPSSFFPISHLLSAAGHGYVPGYIPKVVIDGTTYCTLSTSSTERDVLQYLPRVIILKLRLERLAGHHGRTR